MRSLVLFMTERLLALQEGESGQDLIEYALIAALIALAAVAGMNFVAIQINSGFSIVGNTLMNAI